MSRNGSSLNRTLAVLLPCVFTVGRIACAFYAVTSCLSGVQFIAATGSWELNLVALDNAAKAIAWAILFDCLDGSVARLVGSASTFGREFDSLADVLAFGMAPALLCFVWGVLPVLQVVGPQSGRVLNAAGWLVACAFLVSGAYRLARFNLSEDQPPESGHRSFEGLPIPGGAAVIASIVHFVQGPPSDLRYGVAWLVMAAVLALLMSSRLRYEAFGGISIRGLHPVFLLFFAALLAWAIWVYSNYLFLILALSYAVLGPILHILFRLWPQARMRSS